MFESEAEFSTDFLPEQFTQTKWLGQLYLITWCLHQIVIEIMFHSTGWCLEKFIFSYKLETKLGFLCFVTNTTNRVELLYV